MASGASNKRANKMRQLLKCTAKHPYIARFIAQRAAHLHHKNFYQCRWCSLWHLTSLGTDAGYGQQSTLEGMTEVSTANVQ